MKYIHFHWHIFNYRITRSHKVKNRKMREQFIKFLKLHKTEDIEKNFLLLVKHQDKLLFELYQIYHILLDYAYEFKLVSIDELLIHIKPLSVINNEYNNIYKKLIKIRELHIKKLKILTEKILINKKNDHYISNSIMKFLL